jgi:hypothetical protein
MPFMISLDDAERAALAALLDDYPSQLSAAELSADVGTEVATADALEGLERYGLCHIPAGEHWAATRTAHYLATLPAGPTLATLELILDEVPSQISFDELMRERGTDYCAETADALDELERRGAIHRSAEDFYWTTRSCRRFEQLIGCGYRRQDASDEESGP